MLAAEIFLHRKSRQNSDCSITNRIELQLSDSDVTGVAAHRHEAVTIEHFTGDAVACRAFEWEMHLGDRTISHGGDELFLEGTDALSHHVIDARTRRSLKPHADRHATSRGAGVGVAEPPEPETLGPTY